MFEQNIAGIERVMRLLLGVMVIWAFSLTANGFLILFGILIGLGLIVTGILGYDLFYSVLGINTKKDGQDAE